MLAFGAGFWYYFSMKFKESDDLPQHPDALRKLVLQLLREQEEKDTEHARQIAEHCRVIAQKDQPSPSVTRQSPAWR